MTAAANKFKSQAGVIEICMFLHSELLNQNYGQTHWAGHLASNSCWYFSQADVLSWWTSRHFQSSSLALQQAFRSLALGALISPQSFCRFVNNF